MQRLELKYLISERKALAVRSFVRGYLELDEYGAKHPSCSYEIHSLYLDSDELKTYWDTINGNKNRYKLRLRYYNDDPASPVFFEIKRRMNDAILKQRGGVRREAVNGLLAGHLPEPEHLLSMQPKQYVALQRFCQIMLSIRAVPKAHVCYRREAWISTQDNSVRVTMDREVRVAPEYTSALRVGMGPHVMPFRKVANDSATEDVILELKFTGRFPNWFRDLVESLCLQRDSAAKYAQGVELIGEENFYRNVRLQGAAPREPHEPAECSMDTQRGNAVRTSS
jgi:SPX domain protein involved in polyphosphate accumulation